MSDFVSVLCTVLPATEELVDLSSSDMSYVVKSLSPFTEYNFSISAYTSVGKGPATLITQKTREQGKVTPNPHTVSYH